MELKWEANPYEVPSKINCAIALIAQRLHVHFDTLFGQKKAPKSALIPEKRVAQHRSNKAAGCFAKYYVLPEENGVFYCKTTSTLGTLLTMPT